MVALIPVNGAGKEKTIPRLGLNRDDISSRILSGPILTIELQGLFPPPPPLRPPA